MSTVFSQANSSSESHPDATLGDITRVSHLRSNGPWWPSSRHMPDKTFFSRDSVGWWGKIVPIEGALSKGWAFIVDAKTIFFSLILKIQCEEKLEFVFT